MKDFRYKKTVTAIAIAIVIVIVVIILAIAYRGLPAFNSLDNAQTSEQKNALLENDSNQPLKSTEPQTIEQPADIFESSIYQDYQSLFESRKELRAFFKSAKNLDATHRDKKIESLEAELDRLHQAEHLTSAERLMLQLALLKFNEDQALARQQAQTLVEEYRAITDARNAEFIANPHPQFKDYKAREKQVVDEVMAMSVYPDGLSREAYLAKRLAEIRAEVYQ
jgi:hypothetical protein